MYTNVDVLSVTEAAQSRRSIRTYKQEEMPEADLREILRLTGLAPSAFNLQPWRFVVVRDEGLRTALAGAAYGQKQVRSAPAVIVVYSDMLDTLASAEETVHPGVPTERRAETVQSVRDIFAAKSDAEREAWGAAQTHIALGYLTLVARSRGYDTSVMAGFQPEEVKALLGLPSHVVVPALVAIGRADEEGFTHHRHSVERVAEFR